MTDHRHDLMQLYSVETNEKSVMDVCVCVCVHWFWVVNSAFGLNWPSSANLMRVIKKTTGRNLNHSMADCVHGHTHILSTSLNYLVV